MKFSALALCLVTAAILSATPPERPTLSLSDVSGEPQDISSHVGRLVVLNFWATWCVPCREEMPMLDRLQERYHSRGVVFVGASADDATTRDRVQPFLAERGISFRIWTGATVADMGRLGLSTALPATAILDREGRVAFRLEGPLKRRHLVRRLDYLLSSHQGPVPERCLSTLPELPASDEVDGHDHEGDEDHAHGGVGLEGASLVPS